jgi:hypothetical protein
MGAKFQRWWPGELLHKLPGLDGWTDGRDTGPAGETFELPMPNMSGMPDEFSPIYSHQSPRQSGKVGDEPTERESRRRWRI